jgi:hypothetical protein
LADLSNNYGNSVVKLADLSNNYGNSVVKLADLSNNYGNSVVKLADLSNNFGNLTTKLTNINPSGSSSFTNVTVSGTSTLDGYAYLKTISETIYNNANSSATYTHNASNGGIIYISGTPTSNFTLTITNVPVVDATDAFIFTVICKSYYCTRLAVNTGSSVDLSVNGGTAPSVPIATSKLVVQQICYIYRTAALSHYLTTINVYG